MKSPVLLGVMFADALIVATIFLFSAIDWQSVASMIAAIGGVIAAVYAAKANATALRSHTIGVENKVAIDDVKIDVRKIEVATNSMKDALVLATGQAASAQGQLKGRADQKAETDAAKPPG